MHRQDLRFEHETAWYPARSSDVLSQDPKAKVWTAARAFVHEHTPVLWVSATEQLSINSIKALFQDPAFCQARCRAALPLTSGSVFAFCVDSDTAHPLYVRWEM